MSIHILKYRLHRASGLALVEIHGRRIYLGKYNSPESRERYRRLISQLMSGEPTVATTDASAGLTINASESH